MRQIVRSSSAVPTALFYVLATDEYMSGWGLARDRRVRIIFPCLSRREAVLVFHNLKGAEESFTRPRIATQLPRHLVRKGYLYQLADERSDKHYYDGLTRRSHYLQTE